MAEGEVVQGNTESTADAGVYSNTQATTVQPEKVVTQDPAVEAATKTAVADKLPENYDFKFPEGIEIDKKALDTFIPLMKELKIPKDQAQKFIDIQVGMVQEAQAAHEKSVNEARESWVKAITEDKELGGAKLKESIHIANQGLDKVATDGFKQLLRSTGLGDHPEVVKVFHKIGKMLADDSFVAGGPDQKSGIGNMYNNSPDLK